MPASTRPRRPRSRVSQRLAAWFAAASVIGAPLASQGADTDLVVYDVVVVRPLSALHVVGGAIMVVPALLLALPGGNTREAFNTFLGLPVHELVERPLGEF